MFGLSKTEWRDLLLSVNVHRGNRRLSPVQAAVLIRKALKQTDEDNLARNLGFQELSTMRRILRLGALPKELAALVHWGAKRGSVSMSATAELLRLPTESMFKTALLAAAKNGLTKEEARQVVQIQSRSGKSIETSIESALRTRPIIEREELIIGSLLSDEARRYSNEIGYEEITRKLRIALAKNFPDIICKSIRVNGERFSLLIDEAPANKLRTQLNEKSIETMITELIEKAAK